MRYVASMRTLRHQADLSTLEQIALAESLAEVSTSIQFRYREVQLERSSLDPLSRLAAVLRRHQSITVSIEGHCGLEAPRAIGFQFTRERANSVKTVLVSHGISDDRLAVRGFSNTRPLVWRLGDRAGSANRRVELYVNINGLEVPARTNEFAQPPSTSLDAFHLLRVYLFDDEAGEDDEGEDDDDDADSSFDADSSSSDNNEEEYEEEEDDDPAADDTDQLQEPEAT